MNEYHRFEAALASAWPAADWADVSVLVAVSGGADSTALLCAMGRLKDRGEGQLAAAHFNHRLRQPDADEDQQFVIELCRRLDLPCHTGGGEVTTLAKQEGDGLEAAARRARYAFLQSTAEALGARYVATAHTADDQIETVLHRIVRGTGIAGLRGIRRARRLGEAATLIRPLLEFSRREVLAYLQDIGQPYREDRTNRDLRFTRNRIRHELLPLLRSEFNPQVDDALRRLAQMAGESQEVIGDLVSQLCEQAVSSAPGDTVVVNSAPLAAQPRCLVRELLIAVWRTRGWPEQSMGYAEWDALAEMLSADCAPRMFPGSVKAERIRGKLVLKQTR